jgi:hypothetical protein
VKKISVASLPSKNQAKILCLHILKHLTNKQLLILTISKTAGEKHIAHQVAYLFVYDHRVTVREVDDQMGPSCLTLLRHYSPHRRSANAPPLLNPLA